MKLYNSIRDLILSRKNEFSKIYLDAESIFWRRDEKYYNYMVEKAGGNQLMLEIIDILKKVYKDNNKSYKKRVEKLLNEIK